VADGLTADAVFCCCKVERCKVVGLLDALKRCGGRIIDCVANVEGDIAESEEGMGFNVGAALAVLPRAEKEEKRHDGQIGNGGLPFGGGWEAGDSVLEVDEHFERDWAYTGGWGVLFAVSPELTGQSEISVSEVIVARIFGPHAGEDLGHGAKVLLHRPLANWPAVCGKVASADLAGKELEEGDWVVDAGEGRIEPESSAEKAPLVPVGSVGVARLEWTPAATSSWPRW
jgi:hypothetical protein